MIKKRFLNAATEYYEAGGVGGVTRALQIDEGEVKSTHLFISLVWPISWSSWSSHIQWHLYKEAGSSTHLYWCWPSYGHSHMPVSRLRNPCHHHLHHYCLASWKRLSTHLGCQYWVKFIISPHTFFFEIITISKVMVPSSCSLLWESPRWWCHVLLCLDSKKQKQAPGMLPASGPFKMYFYIAIFGNRQKPSLYR